MTIEHNNDYTGKVFSNLAVKNFTVQRSVFDDCRFIDCDFSFARMTDCRFRDCEFETSNLSSISFDKSKIVGVSFRHCKVTGVDWTTLDWNHYRLGSPLLFECCDISFSVFSAFVLRGLCLRDCKAHEVDFSDSDLEEADFCRTDFQESRFSSCRRGKSNFCGATNYVVDPLDSSIEKAQFSTPDVLSLLSCFNIEIKSVD